MRKIATILTAGLFTVLSASAFACPKGTQIQGGTGPNHKGGKCVATSVVKTKKEASKTTDTAKHDMTKMKDTAKHDASKAKPEATKTVKTS
ncbi:hypothetical protein MMP61_15565 [Acinetobacter sp. NIPH 1958]|uniref:hypothetical protein n=1 Tax=unclassified Acinetobacter TaxID=196816 RepID=UPI00039BDAA7|nr:MULTISPECIES: hypothetical protein [unclassified Acinetobacter]MCH7353133.1 hypothetical protein [Acinetobacter sp. NIPH 2023]MCH7356967.1 hypothetical protein [Acinetobacter sp. NIPH 1958]MCH7360434.1 hypothetical protein [Acinetobacter sp. NIPH 2024]